ncbi:hypothetical protein BAE44_0005551 [Dichanthelium oligosanthes]|uniref:BZIP domain-containing protein n=1 Tax=Dichanthelium oligosanthes TaxID=888268 RepID=A0A1E5W7P6_9POAL|nr:hypothetical protein BAE44_0005551 [Dichanthelium oligosanthes]
MSDDSDGQRRCRRGVTVDVELDAAMALADMAGVGPSPATAPGGADHHGRPAVHQPRAAAPSHQPGATAEDDEEEDLASTRLSLELGKVGIQSAASPCSSSSSAGHPPHPAYHQQQPQAPPAAAATGYGPRPRHMLTEAEKEAKRLRRVLANRESARQTIVRRQAIRDELARKVADLSSQNESMKKVARTTRKAPAATPMHVTAAQHEAGEAMASPPATLPQPGFLYTAAPPAVPVPYVWGSWPPAAAGYEHHHHQHHGSPPGPPPLCLPPPCAWCYPVVADPRGSPSSAYPQPQQAAAFQQQQDPRGGAVAEPAGSGSPAGCGTAEEDTDDDTCSLTLGLDVADKRGAPAGGGAGPSDRVKAATAAEARKRRKELTKLKHMHAGGRPGGEQW